VVLSGGVYACARPWVNPQHYQKKKLHSQCIKRSHLWDGRRELMRGNLQNCKSRNEPRIHHLFIKGKVSFTVGMSVSNLDTFVL
jgi:hypothetical protein